MTNVVRGLVWLPTQWLTSDGGGPGGAERNGALAEFRDA